MGRVALGKAYILELPLFPGSFITSNFRAGVYVQNTLNRMKSGRSLENFQKKKHFYENRKFIVPLFFFEPYIRVSVLILQKTSTCALNFISMEDFLLLA
jgi:hypothetical protein